MVAVHAACISAFSLVRGDKMVDTAAIVKKSPIAVSQPSELLYRNRPCRQQN